MPTIRSRCARYIFKPLWGSIYAPTVGPLCGLYASTMRPPWVLTVLGFNRRPDSRATLCLMRPRCLQAASGFNLWSHSRANVRLLCAHYVPTLGFKFLGLQSKGPPWGNSAPTMRLLCAHYVFKPLWGSIYGTTVGPLCAYYGPTMHPPRVSTVLGFNRRVHSGATLCLQDAHYAPTVLLTCLGWPRRGRMGAHDVLTVCPLCVGAALRSNRWA